MVGVFTTQIDLAQVLIVAFVLFWFVLVWYLQREMKREGYPLEEAVPTVRHSIVGWPEMPPPKTYRLLEGGTVTLPVNYERRELKAQPREMHPGAPLYPVGEPLLAGIGPSSYALRRDEPFRLLNGEPALQPLRKTPQLRCVDPLMDPRGKRILGADFGEAGLCVDVWYDDESKIPRYLEVELDGGAGIRLVPIFYCSLRADKAAFRCDAITGAQFKLAPTIRRPDVITAREEDMVNGFWAGGHMYSAPYKDAIL